MPYPPQLVDPMRKELTSLGVNELLTSAEVDHAMSEASDTTTLIVVNSVCGCAAANARPAVRLAMHAQSQPGRYVTVFAGQDLDATAQMRSYLPGIPPSSPFIALLKGTQPVFVLERRNIEGRTASAIAYDLAEAYQTHCENGASEGHSSDSSDSSDSSGSSNLSDSSPESNSSESPVDEESNVSNTFRSIL